jgi:hypothetical protein
MAYRSFIGVKNPIEACVRAAHCVSFGGRQSTAGAFSPDIRKGLLMLLEVLTAKFEDAFPSRDDCMRRRVRADPVKVRTG